MLRTAVPPLDGQDADATSITLVRRSLFFGDGSFDTVHQAILADREVATGTLKGRLRVPDGQRYTTPQSVSIYWLNPNVRVGTVQGTDTPVEIFEGLKEEPRLVMVTTTDLDGNFSLQLAPGYYTAVAGFTMRPARASFIVKVEEGIERETTIPRPAPTGVRITVVDDATSQPLVARLSFQQVAGGPTVSFDMRGEAIGYYNTYYVKPGEYIELEPGFYSVNAFHGPGYRAANMLIEVKDSSVESYTIRAEKVVPMDGWVGIEMGARTTATPGVLLTAEDYVTMAVAEGLDWIISGDYETLTDFGPVIEKLGLNGRIGSSVGFRTLLPAHPEWGHLLVFPIGEGDPDPKVAREAWADAPTSAEWLAAVRAQYPNALIQIDLPLTQDGAGFFGMGPEANPYVAGWESMADPEGQADLIGVLPNRNRWSFEHVNNFWMNLLVRGRNYIASTTPLARSRFGGEPGYPRLLAYIGEDATISEPDVMAALRKRHTQVTNGPFIDFRVGDTIPGDMKGYDPNEMARLRILSTDWAPASSISLSKESKPQVSLMLNLEDSTINRLPGDDSPLEYEQWSLRGLHIADFKDTLLTVTAVGITPMEKLPLYSSLVNRYPMAIAQPIVIDRNGNGQYDPLKTYPEIGQ